MIMARFKLLLLLCLCLFFTHSGTDVISMHQDVKDVGSQESQQKVEDVNQEDQPVISQDPNCSNCSTVRIHVDFKSTTVENGM